MVIEEYVHEAKQQEYGVINIDKTNRAIIPLSAKNSERLKAYAEKLLSFLKKPEADNLESKESYSKINNIKNIVSEEIKVILSKLINIAKEELGKDDEFIELGIDHVILGKLHEEFEKRWSFTIEPKVIVQAVSVSNLSDSLINQYPKKFEEAFGSKVKTDEVIKEPLIKSVINPVSLADLAYTLQTGRDAMEERVIFLVEDTKDLIDKLEAFVSGKERIENCYQGTVKKSKNPVDILTTDEDSKEMVTKWIAKGKVKKLAKLWSKGLELDWNLLYGEVEPGRISAPTYPFAKERYWIPVNSEELKVKSGKLQEHLHPLVHTNTSDLNVQQFSSTFTGQEFFLADHKVKEEKILPGVAYIEMARAAGALASKSTITHIKNIIWAVPILVNGNSREVDISLYPENGYVDYEVHTPNGDDGYVVHSQGKLITGAATKEAELKRLNIEEIKNRCKKSISANECYEKFAASGLNYGHAFQGIVELYVGDNEAVGRIELPESVVGWKEKFYLHPSLMDAALQTTIGLNAGENGQTVLPFALKELIINNNLPARGFAYARYSEGADPKSSVVKFDIDITDEEGLICASLKEFTARLFNPDEVQKDVADLVYATSEWLEDEVDIKNEKSKSEIKDGTVYLLGVTKERENKLKKELTGLKIEQLDSKGDAATITRNFQTVFKHIKEKLEAKSHEIEQILVMSLGEENRQLSATFSGLFKTAKIENPKIQGKVIEIGSNEKLISRIITRELEPETFENVEVRYTEGAKREVRRLKEVKFEAETIDNKLIKEGGVYWITGGLGGLGRIFAEHIGAVKDVKVILSGRSEKDKANQERLEILKEAGIDAEYIQGDVSLREGVEQIVNTIKEKYNKLNGIIHSAGIVKDAFILKKIEKEVDAVLKPKVSGILNIDEVTKKEKLDFIVLFSSIIGVIGNVGQSDYAAANAFLDVYAAYRNELVKAGKRSGKTISINWPLWKEGGMQVDETSEKMIEQHTGMKSLSTEKGTHAFNRIISQDQCTSVLVATGNISKIREFLKLPQNNSVKAKINEGVSKKKEPVDQDQIENELSSVFCELLKVKENQLDKETEFTDYGVDSILMMKALNLLEEKYESAFDPLAIAQYPTIKELAGYLIGNNIVKVEAHSANQADDKEIKISKNVVSTLQTKRRSRFKPGNITAGKSGKIAIISQACRLPLSNTIEQFWGNLRAGKDLITTVPEGRWDSERFYSLDRSNANTSYTNHGGFIDEIGYFDAEYFGISDHEALTLDPQQRIILELTQELLDRAGYKKEDVSQTRTSVYIGAKENSYIKNNYHLIPDDGLQYTIVNTISNMIAARVSDFYNFTGESKIVDTACSSSLVAIHDACKSILEGESEMAIVGGIFLMMDPFAHVGFSKAQILSDDGKSYVFDERAKGFVLGEGAGLVMLKDYDVAIRDKDRISAVILGSAVNNDGKTMGLTVPNKEGQKTVIQSALARSGITPDTIGYLEAHGTGTLLGDPIEIKATSEVYKEYTNKKGYCAAGAVKSNLGHSMTAAGITGLIKVVLSLQNREIPATLNCEKPHPRFRFEETPFYPNTKLKPWNPIEGKRRAAISSFGFGGTNCHMILEEGPENEQEHYRPRQALPLTLFNRKWYWLGEEIIDENSQDEYFSDLFDRLKNNEITYDICIKKLLFLSAVIIKKDDVSEVSITCKKNKDTLMVSNYFSSSFSNTKEEVANAKYQPASFPVTQKIDIELLKSKATNIRLGDLFYKHKQQETYGSSLFNLQKIWDVDSGVLAEIKITEMMKNELSNHYIHPSVFDACHVASSYLLGADPLLNHQVPFLIKEGNFSHSIEPKDLEHLYCFIEKVIHNDQIAEINIVAYDLKGEALFRLSGFTTKKITNKESFLSDPSKESKVVVEVKSQSESVPLKGDNAYVAKGVTLKEKIQNYLAEKLALIINKAPSDLSVTQNFMDMGFDSNNMVGVVQTIEKEVGIELYPTLFFENQNLTDLIKYFESEHQDVFNNFLGGTKEVVIEAAKENKLDRKLKSREYKAITAKRENPFTSIKNANGQEDIAIIGMSGYLADSSNLDEFWDHIEKSHDMVTEIPKDHWDYEPWFDANREAKNKTYSKWGSFLSDIDKFDPLFFRLPPRQAEWIDPQLRLLLQSVQETIEDAGVAGQIKGTKTGVYVGCCFHEYWDEIVRAQIPLVDYQHSSSAMSSLSGMVSYAFDFQGGSIPLDNACASSLTALHLGCQALKNAECDTAIISGINVLLSPLHYVYFSRLQALSPTGRCHTFDKRADGYVPGEGIVSILIKPLSKAVEEGDNIHAIIKGTAINHVGRSNNPTSPRPELQTKLVLDAWKNANIDPETISYMEAHGTGTLLGDPIEINALKKAFKEHTNKKEFCVIGSIKAHIGHLEGAAGLAGLIKVVLSMKHKMIPKMPNFEEVSPYIKLENSPFFINTRLMEWESNHRIPRRAGVSSFGMTGNNAHAVIEEYIYPQSDFDNRNMRANIPMIIPMSAKNKEQLNAYTVKFVNYLKTNKKSNTEKVKEIIAGNGNGIRDAVEMEITHHLSKLMSMEKEEIEREEVFVELGIDQVVLSKLHEELEDKYSFTIDPKVITQAENIDVMREKLVKQYAKEFEKTFGSNVKTEEVIKDKSIKSGTNSISLTDLAYTLQTGREAMDERVAFIAGETDELVEKLESYISKKEKIDNCYQGQVRKSKDEISLFATDEDSKEMLNKWITKGKLKKLAELWVKGLELDWSLLYGEEMPKRISAPTYPFAKERCWIELKSDDRSQGAEGERKLHPLIHTNTSDLKTQQFSSTFTGQEFFLNDHRVKNEKIVPGVAYLEMARAAGELASRETVTHLENIVWAKPITVNGKSQEVKISLYPENGHIAYEVHTCDDGIEPVIHSQGRLITESSKKSETKSINIKEIQIRCKTKIASKECYEKFNEIGLNYGPAFQGIHELYVGTTEALGLIELPETVTGKSEMYRLHPSLMDAALQTTMGLNVGEDGQIAVPFALKELSISSKLSAKAFAYARHSKGNDPKGDIVKFDIDIVDEEGVICVSLKEFAVQVFREKVQLEEIIYTLQWARKSQETVEADKVKLEGKSIVIFHKDGYGFEKEIIKQEKNIIKIILGSKNKKQNDFCLEINGQEAKAFETLFEKLPGDLANVYFLSGLSNKEASNDLENDQETAVLSWFRCIKGLIQYGYAQKELNIVVLTQDCYPVTRKEKVNAHSAGIIGLTQSLAKEYPNWSIKNIDISANELRQIERHKELYDVIQNEVFDKKGKSVAYREGYRYEQEILPLSIPGIEKAKFRQEGVYVIVGGAGGLGVGFSEYLIKTYNAQMIWLGRRACDDKIRESIADLEKSGKPPIYIQADTADIESTKSALSLIKSKVNKVHGVIHSALVLKDQSLDKMSEENFKLALDSKMSGSINLVEVFKLEKLDWLCFFSSVQSIFGASGQSNYAAGCTFQDAYAYSLREKVSFPVHTINWGYWGEIGVVATDYYREQMSRQGMDSLKLSEGTEILERTLSNDIDRLIVIKATGKAKEMIGVKGNERLNVYPVVVKSSLKNVIEMLPDRTKELDKLKEKYCGQMVEEFALRGLLQSIQKLGWDETVVFESVQELKSHLGIQEKYKKWLAEIVRVLTEKGLVKTNQYKIELKVKFKAFDIEKEAAKLVKGIPELKAQVELLKDCLVNLGDIVTGKTLATDILFPNSSMEKVQGIYKNNPIADFYNESVADVVEAYVEMNKKRLQGEEKIRLLEVGAGTGGTSAFIFKRLMPYSDIIEYTFTDISKSFLMRAEEVYKEKSLYLKTALFNVEKPLAGQPVESNSYDIVIAANVLHATKNMVNTLDQVKEVLKNNGILILNELSKNSLFATLTFGLTAGWWLFEDEEIRLPGSPGLSFNQWERVLSETGFGYTRCGNMESQVLGQQVIIVESQGLSRQKIQIESMSMDLKVNETETIDSRQNEQKLNPKYTLPSKNNLSQSYFNSEKDSIIIQNQNKDVTLITNETISEKVKDIVLEQISKALKMSKNSVRLDNPLSDYGVDSIIGVELIQEINKVLNINLSTVALFDYPTVDKFVNYIIQEKHDELVVTFGEKLTNVNKVLGYSTELVNGSRPINHLQKEKQKISLDQLGSHVRSSRFTSKKTFLNGTNGDEALGGIENKKIENSDIAFKKLLITGPGEIDDIQLVNVTLEKPGPSEVLVAIHAFALNFGDILCVKGLYPTMPPYPYTPGFEAAGKVVEIGAKVSKFKIGDKVVAVADKKLGLQASYVLVSESQLMPKLPTLSYEEACGLPVVSLTIIEVFRKANLMSGETILIQTAAGGTGLIAVQLAQHFGATVIATASLESKLEYLGSLGVPHLINYDTEDFEERVQQITNGNGVDVVVNTLSGENIQKGIRCLGSRGRYVEIAMTALKSARQIDLSSMSNNQSFHAIDLRKLMFDEPEYALNLWDECEKLVKQGVIHTTISKVFSFDSIKEAYTHLADRKNIGKIIISVPHQVLDVNPQDIKMIRNERLINKDIAIIGMSGRFPVSPDLSTFWKNIEDNKDLITEIPKDRWDWKEYWGDSDKEVNKTKAKWGGFIDDVDKFDPMFFRVSPREAELMDPQHRLLMQTVWHTLEDAAYTKKDVAEKAISVFVGICTQDYAYILQGLPLDAQSSMGMAHSMAANRISYWLNLQGMSEPVDTACSSALVAICKGIQSIHNDGCEMAIAGGVNIILSPENNIAFDKASVLTHQPTVKTFDKDAEGYVRGEGVGAVLLKPLSKAIEAGDHIYAVIKGCAVNHNGQSQSLTAPNSQGQQKAITQTFEKAGLIGQGLDYIEAHGTATDIGDPIEINAIKNALLDANCGQHACKIGAIKPNIGHLEAASGMAVLFKVIFAMQNRIKPGVKGFKELNPYIEIKDTPLYIKAEHEQWENNKNVDGEKLPRRAGINSFGFGGVNAFLILEEYTESNIIETKRDDAHLFVLSAQTNEQLIVYAQTWLNYLNRKNIIDLSQATYTLQLGREAFDERLAIVINDKSQLIQSLQIYLNNSTELFVENNIFTNANSHSDMVKLITDDASADFVLRAGIEDKNLRKLALLWIEGFEIPWNELYKDKHVRKTSLPTYPFAKERCWIETKNENESTPELRKSIDNKGELFEFDHARSLKNNITNYLVQTISKELDITRDKVKLNKNLQDYGLDSIVGMKIMRGINETFQIKMTGREMLEHTTIESISEHISKKAILNREEDDNKLIEPKLSDKKDASIRIELSEGQKGLWALQKFSPDMSTYNVPIVFKIEQKLDISSIKKACEFLLKEYPILNTIIQEDNGVPYQTISNNDLFFQEEKINHLKEKEIIPFVQKRVNEPFDLEKGPLMRVHLFSVSVDEIILLITFHHHLIIDGTSTLIFIKTLWNAYYDYLKNNIPNGVIHSTKYSDFVEWEKNMLNKPEGKVHLDYWREQLAGELPVLSLPVNHSNPVEQSYKGITYTELVDSQLSENIEQFAKRHKANLSVVFLGIFKFLLFRYSAQDDIIVGMTTLGRPERRFEDVMGYFVNMIPLRSRLSNDQPFIEFLKELQLTLVDGLDHSVYPFPCLVKNLKLSSDRKAPPVFQAAFIYKNFAQNLSIKDLINPELFNIASGDAQISLLDGIHQECADVFRLEIYKDGNCFKLNFKYNPDLFDASIIEQMMGHYIKLVQEIIKRPDLEIGCFDILLEKEKQQQPLMPNNIINRKKPAEQDYDLNPEITDHAEANETEKKLLEIWQMVCGDQNIALDEDFFEYDLDSIRAAQFLSIINKNFSEKNITASDLFQKPTIKDLALILDNKQARLNSETSEKDTDKEPLTTMQELSKNAPIKNEDRKEKAKSISPDIEHTSDSILIPLTESEGKISFYCLASGHGDLLRFSNLSEKLKEDCSFYMLQPPDNALLDDKNFNLNYLVEIYANLIMSRETEKCIIGGFCIGGVLTLEISEILKKEGLDVGNPILIDSPFPMFSRCRYNFRKLMKYIFNLPGIENSWVGKLSINGRTLDLFFSDSGLLAQTKMLHLYKPKDYHGSANIIISKTLSYFEQLLFDRWNSYVKGSLKKHYIPGFHGNIFNDQNINCLAETIKKCLK